MKTHEDEAFDEIAKRQGGFQAKRQMAADKMQEPEGERAWFTISELNAWADKKLTENPHWATFEKAALAQPAQEPAEWLTGCPTCGIDAGCDCDTGTWNPPQREWVDLEPEDRLCAKYMLDAPEGIEAVIDYITAKLKEKNNGK